MFKVIAIQSNSGNKEINLSMFNQYFWGGFFIWKLYTMLK
jgi:hypothetical protein